ncbi:MAG: tetratricopeptide repeat protein [Thermaurantimonas sp.]
MKDVFLLLSSLVFFQHAYSQNDSWNARFILSVNPMYSDEEQKDTLNKLLSKAEEEDVQEAKPLYYNALAAYYYQVEKPESMITYLYKAIEVNLKQNNSTLLSTNYNLLSIYHQEQQDYTKALDAINRAIEYLDTIKQPILYKIYKSNRAAIYFMKGDYENAAKVYEENIDFYLSAQDTTNYAGDLYNLAFSYYKMGDFQKARKTLTQFMKMYENYSEKDELVELHAEVCGIIEKIHFDEDNFSEALKYQLIRLQIARQLNLFTMISETCDRLSVTYEKQGQYKDALYYNRMAAQYRDSLLNETRVKALAEMESKYENKIKTLELADAQNRVIIEQRRKKLYLTLNVLILTILVGGSILVYQKIKLDRKELLLTNEQISKMIKDHELETANALLKGQELERENLAQELHDRVGGIMGNIIFQLQLMAKNLSNNPPTREQLKSIADIVKEAAEEIRRISHNMSSGVIHRYGLKAALDEFSQKVTDSGRLVMTVEYTPADFPRLSRELETHVYRIIQEFTTNTLKHAKASQINMYVSLIHDELELVFEDNGRGFDTGKKTRGIGIYNIEHRIKTLKGQITIDSRIGRGTAISIKIPLQKNALYYDSSVTG